MPSPPPNVIVGEPTANQNPYRHQGAYVIRRPSPSSLPQPNTISDDIKKSYMRQQLPVRNQSLAAAATAAKAVNILYDMRSTNNSAANSSTTTSCTTTATRHPSNASDESADSNCPATPPSLSTSATPSRTKSPSFFASLAEKRRARKNNEAAAAAAAAATSCANGLVTTTISPTPINTKTHHPCEEAGKEQMDPTVARSNSSSSQNHEWNSLHEYVSSDDDDDDDDDDYTTTPQRKQSTATTESNHIALAAQQQAPLTATAVVSPMAYETEDQQNEFFSHYGLSTGHVDSALLSHVAREMYNRIMPDDVVRDGVEYHYLFTGKEAVDRLVDIIHGNDNQHDRNRALMIGRSLEAQGLFRDIDGEHRLRDDTSELYRFEAPTIDRAKEGGDANLATGVFTALTPCYSPTCNSGTPCYSPNCPGTMRKVIKRSASQSSLPDKENTRALWIHSVPKDVVAATPPEERKRQECIYELIYTEEDFSKDLDYVHNHYVIPLMTTDILSQGTERREQVVQQIFWNLADIRRVTTGFTYALSKRRKQQDLVDTIGDVMMSFVRQFDPYISYGAHQVIGKHNFELEKRRNPRFAQFVSQTERKPESRRLELNGYLTKPTTRLGRYNLLLREILKRTPEGNPDLEIIPQVMEQITHLLERVNSETGRVEREFTLRQIDERMIFKSTSIFTDLKLQDPERQLVMQGRLKRKGNSSSDSSEMQVFLFDHYLVLSKTKMQNHLEHYKVSRKPIPLDVLSLSVVDVQPQGRHNKPTASSSTSPGNGVISPRPSTSASTAQTATTPVSADSSSTPTPSMKSSQSMTTTSTTSTINTTTTTTTTPSSSSGPITPATTIPTSSAVGSYGIVFYHHGRGGSPPVTLYTNNAATRQLWVDKILAQKEVYQLRLAESDSARKTSISQDE